MKKLILNLLTFLTINCAFAKSQYADTIANDFLGPLHYIKGKAKVTIKAVYYDIHRASPLIVANGHPEYPYDRKTLLNERIYSGTDIGFTINEDTTSVKSAPFVCKCTAVNHLKSGTIVYLTCLVFKDYKGDYGKFFVVENITTNSPKNRRAISH